MRLLALAGLGLSSYLLFFSLNGTITSVAGCGEGGDCANVLGSRWSQIFGLPVSGLAAGLYLVLLGLTFRPAKSPLVCIAFLLLAGALWFTGLQIFVIRSFCPLCLAAHAIGTIAAMATLLWVRPAQAWGRELMVSATLIGSLAAGQVYGPAPETHAVTEVAAVIPAGASEVETSSAGMEPDAKDPAASLPIHERGSGPLADFAGKRFRVAALPHLGSSDSEHVLVKYFDYTCGACQDLHRDLEALENSYPGAVSVIVLPTPLHRSCNPHLPVGFEDHRHACELARFALAVWRDRPEAFAEVHELLFTHHKDELSKVRESLTAYISTADLESALADPWIDELLAANLEEYALFVGQSSRMPKLRIADGKLMSGLARNTEQFVQLIASELKLDPAAATDP
ncbi:vitamin K epoxide reductase family protein [soil metagenome]